MGNREYKYEFLVIIHKFMADKKSIKKESE